MRGGAIAGLVAARVNLIHPGFLAANKSFLVMSRSICSCLFVLLAKLSISIDGSCLQKLHISILEEADVCVQYGC